MKYVRRIIYALLLTAAEVFLWANLRPIPKTGLTESACLHRNEVPPDAPGVVYESVMSYCKKAQHGKLPLNMTYPIVKHFDGLNDGLVSVESAKWGEQFTLLKPEGKRGISHGDVVDLNRENIRGFDVREFYVKLAADLKRWGY